MTSSQAHAAVAIKPPGVWLRLLIVLLADDAPPLDRRRQPKNQRYAEPLRRAPPLPLRRSHALAAAAANAIRAMQQFIGDGAWDDQAILKCHWREVDDTLGDEDGVLTLDGSDFLKQGRESGGGEGVGRRQSA